MGPTLVVTDPTLGQTYLYAATGGVTSTYGGVATHASFSPDSQTVYITTGTVTTPANPLTLTPAVITPSTQLLVHAGFTGWTPSTANSPASDVTVTVPSVGAYFAGTTTTGRSYCTSTTLSADGLSVLNNEFYPLADSASVQTDRVVATSDGLHILGATVAGGVSLTDLGFSQTAPKGLPIGACPQTVSPNLLHWQPNLDDNHPPWRLRHRNHRHCANARLHRCDRDLHRFGRSAGIQTCERNITPVTLTGTATAPVAGVASADDSTFFVGTSGDNSVHLVDTHPDRQRQADDRPNLPAFIPAPNGPIGTGTDNPATAVTPDLLVQRPRRPTA